MRRKFTLLVSLYCSCIAAAGQTFTLADGPRIDAVFSSFNKPDSPGCAVGVYLGGQIAYAHGYGMANLNDDVPITPSTVFHVASMSKQFTATAILLLQAQGKLSVNDDVHRYLPELPDFGHLITLSELMHHTSGMRDQWDLLNLNGWRYSKDLITDEDVMSVVSLQRHLNFNPGEKMLYSNTGYTLLALIVKRVSGKSLREFTSESIFVPLGMTHTHFRDDHEEVIKHDALGYEQAGESKPFRMDLTNFDTTGATSLHTTVEDLQRWDENFYEPRVGGSQLITKLLERGKLNDGKTINYASGLGIGKYREIDSVEHSGADAGYVSDMMRLPAKHTTVSVLCNTPNADPGGLVRKVVDLLLFNGVAASSKPNAAPEPAMHRVDPALAREMAADYWDKDDNSYTWLLLKDGKLQTDLNSDDTHELMEFEPKHFHVADVSWGKDVDIHFLPATGGKPRTIEVAWRGGKPHASEAVSVFTPSATDLQAFEGRYRSPELTPIFDISVRDNSLQLYRLKYPVDKLRPVTQDTFVGDIGTVRFTRQGNHITGFILDAGRIRNLEFMRSLY